MAVGPCPRRDSDWSRRRTVYGCPLVHGRFICAAALSALCSTVDLEPLLSPWIYRCYDLLLSHDYTLSYVVAEKRARCEPRTPAMLCGLR